MMRDLWIVAALLHDIGKFAQRADAPFSQGMEEEYGNTYKHIFYTDYFIRKILPLPGELEASRSALARLASAHHNPNPNSREETALQNADCTSSGCDRIKGESGGSYKTARLESIFSRVVLNGKRLDKKSSRYRLSPIDAKDSPIFPLENDDPGCTYKKLYAEFCEALKKIPCDLGTQNYISSLTSLLERFTWCIPSSTYETQADISLFDHSTTTAAIMQALLKCPKGNERLLLFGGEISGIQKFIFGVEGQSDKGASKLLRARSLYIQAITRSLWLTLLHRLGLGHVAKIMDAGGRFVLLLPEMEESLREIETLKHEAEEWLLKTFQGMVRMNFASLGLTPYDLQRENFIGKFDQFNDAMEEAKLSPFSSVFAQNASSLLPGNAADYAEYGECEFCHLRPAKDTIDDAKCCRECQTLIEKIGRKLPRAKFLVFGDKRQNADALPLFGNLGMRVEDDSVSRNLLQNALDVLNIRDYSSFSAAPIAGYVPMVSKTDISRYEENSRFEKRDGEIFLDNEKCEIGAPKTFAMLAEEACIQEDNRIRSIACLASCKADVDNLGLLFSLGFGVGTKGGKNYFSISRFAMLSRMLNYFFSAYLPRLIAREYPNIYVIFAGGDDLFTLGPWSDVIEFGLHLQEDFARFTGNNLAVTFSCGFTVIKPNLPMRALKRAAEESLEQSKKMDGKNAATLFGVTASWSEFRRLYENGLWLERLALPQGSDKAVLSQGFVRRMLGYARDCRDFGDGDIRKGLYLSHMMYDLKRNCIESDATRNDILKIKQLGQAKNAFPKEELGITWALYRTRTR